MATVPLGVTHPKICSLPLERRWNPWRRHMLQLRQTQKEVQAVQPHQRSGTVSYISTFNNTMKNRVGNSIGALCAAMILALPLAPAQAHGEETVIGGVTGATTENAALPTGGASLLPPQGIFALKLAGKAAQSAKIEEVAVEKQPFARALRVTTQAKSAEADITLSAPITTAFKDVDTVFVRLYEITVSHGGGSKTVQTTLPREGKRVDVTF